MITGRKLLLADDSVTIQKVVSLIFTDEGLEVVTVGNGDHALQRLEEDAPDIVLADVFMPGLNGYELCERIKSDERFRHIPVLLLVGTFEPFNEAEARKVGADDVLTKPFQSIRELIGKVGSLLGGRPANEETATETSPPRAPAADELYHTVASVETPAPPAAPAASPWNDASDAAAAAGQPSPPRSPLAPVDAYADFGMDDQTIEVTPPRVELDADSKGADTRRTFEEATPPSPPATSFAVTGNTAQAETPLADETDASDRGHESRPSITMKEKQEDTPIAQSGFSSHVASANAADDALLDLGEIRAPSAATDADDFILDLADEAPAASPAAPVAEAQTEARTGGAGPPAGFEATSAGGEPAGFARSLTSTEFTDTSSAAVVDYVAAPPLAGKREAPADAKEEGSWAARPTSREAEGPSAAAAAPQSSMGAPGGVGRGQAITLDQLPPEVIDAIARRAVEQLSEKVVQEIAWEVVPQLAELLIKQRLEEEKSRMS